MFRKSFLVLIKKSSVLLKNTINWFNSVWYMSNRVHIKEDWLPNFKPLSCFRMKCWGFTKVEPKSVNFAQKRKAKKKRLQKWSWVSINPLADRESHQVPEKFLGPSCSVVFLTSLSLFLNMIVGGLWYYYVACCSSVSSVVDSRLGSQVSMLETSTFRGRGTIRSRMLAFCFFFSFLSLQALKCRSFLISSGVGHGVGAPFSLPQALLSSWGRKKPKQDLLPPHPVGNLISLRLHLLVRIPVKKPPLRDLIPQHAS